MSNLLTLQEIEQLDDIDFCTYLYDYALSVYELLPNVSRTEALITINRIQIIRDCFSDCFSDVNLERYESHLTELREIFERQDIDLIRLEKKLIVFELDKKIYDRTITMLRNPIFQYIARQSGQKQEYENLIF